MQQVSKNDHAPSAERSEIILGPTVRACKPKNAPEVRADQERVQEVPPLVEHVHRPLKQIFSCECGKKVRMDIYKSQHAFLCPFEFWSGKRETGRRVWRSYVTGFGGQNGLMIMKRWSGILDQQELSHISQLGGHDFWSWKKCKGKIQGFTW
ncbi:hypothetical protein E1B28_012642 [Marasmius oreades]|uniref:Uncharacterized protein n=1 Tax=Marasmius oreades TaxID=181124 RepID=A0A9P7UP64_9AGAR|nr:uncharacterized protein E1B28_012642 [Marasmius oreades]KAG7088670.1 hypothetical protein E1B28_012642 [Marasmius oreades]